MSITPISIRLKDEDTVYDQSTRVGRQIEATLILDRVVLVQTWHIFYFKIT